MPHRSTQFGFALLMTLVLLALAAVTLAAVGRHSFRQALLAQRQLAAVQRKWAFASCSNVLLSRAEQVMTTGSSRSETPSQRPDAFLPMQNDRFGGHSAIVRRTITLGGDQVTLIFADEQAKLNVNTLLKRTSRETATQRLQGLMREAGVMTTVRLRPLDQFDRRLHQSQYGWLPIAGFDQMFIQPSPAALLGGHGQPGAAAWVTCWGDGKVDFRRAAPAVLVADLAPLLDQGQVEQLVMLRERDPHLTADEALGRLRLTSAVLHQLKPRLTDGGSCYSLWVVIDDGSRKWVELTVHDRAKHGSLAIKRFSW